MTDASSSRRSTSRRRKPAARPSSTNAGIVDNSPRRQRPIARLFRGGVAHWYHPLPREGSLAEACANGVGFRHPSRASRLGRRRHMVDLGAVLELRTTSSCRSSTGPAATSTGRSSSYASYDKRFSYAAAAATRAAQFLRRIRWNSPLSQIRRVPLLRTAPEMGLMDAEGS